MNGLILNKGEDVEQAIRKRGRQIAGELSDKEVFLSPEFAHYSTRIADYVLRARKLYNLKIQFDRSESAPIAFTDGKIITWNTGNHLAASGATLEDRFRVNMGILFHECAHKLFLNFDVSNDACNSIIGGSLYGVFATDGDPVLEQAKNELESATEKYGPMVAKFFHEVANIVDDGHDESAMKRAFPGFITSCIQAAGRIQMECAGSVSEAVQRGAHPVQILFSMMLEYAKYGEYKLGDDAAAVEPYMQKMQEELEPLIDQALVEHDYKARWNLYNSMMLRLWPYLRDLFSNADQNQAGGGDGQEGEGGNSCQPDGGQQSGSSGSQGQSSGSGSSASGQPQGADGANSSQSNGGQQNGSSDSTEQSEGSGSSASGQPQGADGANSSQSNGGQQNGSSDSTEQSAGSGSSASGQTQGTEGSGVGTGGAADNGQSVEQAVANLIQEIAKNTPAAPAPINGKGSGLTLSDVLRAKKDAPAGMDASALLQAIAQNMASSEIQKTLDAAEKKLIQDMNVPASHKGVPLSLSRHLPARQSEYESIAKENAPYVRALVAQIKAFLRELNEEAVQHHRRYGPMVEATEAFRPDRAFFAKKKLPEDLPNMAVCVLVDQSGSMAGEKLRVAKQATILLDQFARDLKIPCMIAGHDTTGTTVNLRIYTDFLSAVPVQDRYSLAGMGAGGCNRDGMAIRICGELLAKRPENVRLMVVISDGQPYHGNYYGLSAMEDISAAVRDFRRKGILCYGAAIDDDREQIQQIYGQSFLSINDLSALPKVLIRLMRQNLLK